MAVEGVAVCTVAAVAVAYSTMAFDTMKNAMAASRAISMACSCLIGKIGNRRCAARCCGMHCRGCGRLVRYRGGRDRAAAQKNLECQRDDTGTGKPRYGYDRRP